MSSWKILIAPGPFKECLSAREVADCIEKGITRTLSSVFVRKLPMCDGGTGFVRTLVEHAGGTIKTCQTLNPLGEGIESYYGIVDLSGTRIGIIETAAAAGLALVPPNRRDPRTTSTRGVGILIKQALDDKCQRIIIGCGDSATNDGGMGMAMALGVVFLDAKGKELKEGGIHLQQLKSIDLSGLDPRIQETSITVACNLTSILCGSEGTSRVYGPQKGATEEAVNQLSEALENYANVLQSTVGKDVRYLPGAGSAGGLAAGLYALMGAQLRYSLHVVSDFVRLDEHLRATDILITGEGRVDKTSASGKLVSGIALLAKKYDIPVFAITGSVAEDADMIYYTGVDYVEPICNEPMSVEDSFTNAKRLICDTSSRIARMLSICSNQCFVVGGNNVG
ncbi:MAG: glycerate kinase [Candidatus Methanomethylicaceae archaeon]